MPKRFLGLPVLALVLALGVPHYAQAAAPASWTDAADDADATLPNDAALDLLKVNASSDGKKLTWTASVKALAAQPALSTGASYRFHFVHNDVGYFFAVDESAVFGAGVTFAPEEAADPTTVLDCSSCSGRIDRPKNQITLTVPLTTLTSGFRATDPSAPKAEPGVKLTDLLVDSWRDEVVIVLLADDAPAPENTVLAL